MKERLKLVFVGTYLISFLFLNIQSVAIILLGTEPISERFDIAVSKSHHWSIAYFAPLVITITVTLGGPYVDWLLAKLRGKAHHGMKSGAINLEISLEKDRMALLKDQVARDIHRAKEEAKIDQQARQFELQIKEQEAAIADSHERTQLERLKSDLNAKERQLEETERNLKSREESLEQMMQQNTRQIASLQNQNASYEDDLKHLRSSLRDKERIHDELVAKSDSKVNDLTNQLQKTSKRVQNLLETSVEYDKYVDCRQQLYNCVESIERLGSALMEFDDYGKRNNAMTIKDLPDELQNVHEDIYISNSVHDLLEVPSEKQKRSNTN